MTVFPAEEIVQPYRLVLTQGDPAGVGPEILLKALAARGRPEAWSPLVIAEQAALESVRTAVDPETWDSFRFFADVPSSEALAALPAAIVPVVDPLGERRKVIPGRSGAADAAGALAALDLGIQLTRQGVAAALVTCPLSKASIARHCLSDFRGHTDYLAASCGLERYGRDYLMAFLTDELQVALLTTHIPLRQAIEALSPPRLVEALCCLERAAGGRIAVAGLNPHAGEGGLLGSEDEEYVRPAVEEARQLGLDVVGPESPDTVFWRARNDFDWVLSLYHDQGLIAVKTAGFGLATNWTLGLPFLRTSVDHGTAFEIAGGGMADASPLQRVIATTLAILQGDLPRGRRSSRLAG